MLKDIKFLIANLIRSPYNTELLDEIQSKLKSDEISLDDKIILLEKSHQKAINANQTDLAFTFLDIALELSPNNTDIIFKIADFSDNILWSGELAIKFYKKLTELSPDNEEWKERLEDLEIESSNWNKLLDKFVSEAEESTEPELASHMFFRASEVASKYSDNIELVEDLLKKALEHDSSNKDVVIHLAYIFRKNKKYEELANLLISSSVAFKESSELIAIMLEISSIFIEHLDKSEEAIGFINKILEINPNEDKAKALLVEAYTILDKMEDLIEFYENEIKNNKHPDPGIFLQLGMLWWKKVGDLDSAEPYFQKIRKTEPTSPLLLNFYGEYYTEKGDYIRHIGLLQQAMRVAKNDLDLTLQIARKISKISIDENPDKAIDVWQQILKKNRDNTEAKEELKKLYNITEKWNFLVDLYKDEESRLEKDDIEGRVAVKLKKAQIIEEHMGVDAMVVNVYNNILKIDPSNDFAISALAEKYKTMNRWKDVISIYQKKADNAEDLNDKKNYLKEIASYWKDKLSNPNKAAEPLEQILEIDASDLEVINLLKNIYEGRRNWKGLFNLRSKELELVSDSEKLPSLIELAKFAQQPLGNMKLAIETWNRVLEFDKYDIDAIEALSFLYEREKRYPALVEILRRRISMSTNEEALPLLEKAGTILTDKIHSMGPLSMEIWQTVHNLKPGHPKAVKILKNLYVSNKNWEELQHLFEEKENWLNYIETLSHAADHSKDPDEKILLYFKVADIYCDKINKPERSVKSYEHILKVDPNNAKAAENLLPLYEAGKKWKLSASMYEILYGNSESLNEKLTWLQKLIDVNKDKINNSADSFKWAKEAYLLDPENSEILEQLEFFAQSSGKWQELSEIYSMELEKLEEDLKIQLYARLARIYVEELTELEKGEQIWKNVLELNPNSEEALKGLSYIYEIEENWDSLTHILEKQIELASNPVETLWAREKMASITENQLQNKEQAIVLYNNILDIDNHYIPALIALDNLYGLAEQFDKLCEILLLEREYEEDEEKQRILDFKIGELYSFKLNNKVEGLNYFENVLINDENNLETINSIRKILDSSDDEEIKVRAANLLTPYYSQQEMWEDYIVTLEVIAFYATDREQKVSYYRDLLSITTQRVGDMGKGFELAISLFHLQPSDIENRQKLRTLAKLDDKLDILKNNYLELIESDTEDLTITLSWEVAVIEEEDNENLSEAEKYYKIVLSEDPLHQDAFDALERLYISSERWNDTRVLYQNKIESLDDIENKKEMLLRLSKLNEDRLGDIDAAIESYSAIREIEPGAKIAFKPLERLYEISDNWEKLASLYEDELDFTADPKTRIDLLFNRCQLYLSKLELEDEAIDLINEILEIDQNHEPTRKTLVGMLDIAKVRQASASILEKIYEKEADFEELIRMLDIKLEAVEDDYEAVELLLKESKVLTIQMAEPEKAFETLKRAITRDPSNTEVRKSIEQLALAINAYEELVTVWESAIKFAEEDENLILLYLEKIALIFEKKLDEPEKAIEWYRKLLEHADSDTDLQSKSINALINLYSSLGEWIEIIDLHKKQLEFVDWDEERKNIYRKIANLQEDMLDAPDDASKTYNQLLDEFPEDDEAIERLESIYSRIEKWDKLVDVLSKKAELSNDREMRISCFSRIAILREESLDDIEGAASAWSNILNEDPENDEALRYLARLNESLGNWNEVFDFVERELALTTNEEEIRSLHYRLGYILQVHLEEPERAINFYKLVLDEEPTHEKAKLALENMLQGDEILALQAAEILEVIYEMEDDWEHLTGLYVLQAGYSMDPHEKVSLFLKIASIKENELGEPIAAFGFYGQALKEAGSEPELPEILAHLQRLASIESKWDSLVTLYKQVGEDILNPKIQEQVYLTIADISRDELDDLETSKTYYEKVLEDSPENGHALDALERVYEATQDPESLLNIYLTRSEMSLNDEDARYSALLNAAKLCKEKLEKPEDAIEYYNTILEFRPDDKTIFIALEEILFDLESWDSLIELYEHRIRFTESIKEAVEIRFNMGEIFDDFLEEPDRALESFCAAMGGDPSSEETVKKLEKFLENEDYAGTAAEVLVPIYAARQNWENLIKVFSLQRDLIDSPEERASLTKRIAELYETVMEDLEKAFEWYGYLLLEQPENRTVRNRLINLAENLDKWKELSVIFSEIIDNAYGEEPHIIEILEFLARIYSTNLGMVDESMECFKKILENDFSRESIFNELETLLIENSRWDELLEVYREASDSVYEPDVKNVFLFKICSVLEDKVEKFEDAVDVYKEILDSSPDNENAISALTKLFTKLGKWEELVDHLITQVESESDEDKIIALNLKLAELYNEKLEDPSSSVDKLENILQLDPQNEKCVDYLEKLLKSEDVKLRVAIILQPIYKNLGYWDQLILVYEAQIELIDDDYQKISLLKECANLYDTMDDNIPKAFDSMSKACILDTSDRSNLEELYNLTTRQGNWQQLIDVLEKCIEDSYDSELQIEVLMRIALIQSETLEETENAIKSYRRVLEIQEDHIEALSKLSTLYRELENWENLAEVLETKSELLSEPEETTSLLRELGQINQELLNNSEKAIETWQKLLYLSPSDTQALAALESLFEADEAWEELSEILKSIIELNNENKIDKSFKLALIQESKLDDSYEATNALKVILEEDPNNIDAIEILAKLYQKDENWNDLILINDKLITLESDDGKRNSFIFKNAQILLNELGDTEGAIDKFRLILDFDNQHTDSINELDKLLNDEEYRLQASQILEPIYINSGNDVKLISMYKLLLEDENDSEKRKDTLKSIAELYEKLEDLPNAFTYWGLLFKEDPSDENIEQQLTRIASMDESWSKLIDIYNEVIDDIYDEDLKKKLLFTEARILEISLSDMEGAVKVMQKASEEIPDNLEILSEYDRLLVATGNNKQLAEVIELEANSTFEPNDKANLLYRLGDIRLNIFEDEDGAIDAWKETLELNSNHEDALAAIETLMAKETDSLSDIINILEPVYESLSKQEKLVNLLLFKVKISDDENDTASYYERAAKISSELGNIEEAVEYWWLATTTLPDEPSYIEQLIAIADLSGKHSYVISQIKTLFDSDIEDSAFINIALKTAEMSIRYGDIDSAELFYSKILKRDEENIDSLKALEELYRVNDASQKLISILDKRSEFEYDSEKKKAILVEIASLSESMENIEKSIECWVQILEQDESDDEAQLQLMRLYESSKLWENLIETMRTRLNYLSDPETAQNLRREIATIITENMNNPEEAEEAWRDAYDTDPSDNLASEALLSIYKEKEEWDEVKDLYYTKLSMEKENEGKIAVLFDLAKLSIKNLDEPDEAADFYRQILDIDPSNDKAYQKIEVIYNKSEQYYELIEILKKRTNYFKSQGNNELSVLYLDQMAQIWEEKLESPQEAIKILDEILSAEPGNVTALTGMARLYENMEEWEKCQQYLEKAALLEPQGREGAELAYRRGNVALKLNDSETAVSRWKQALELFPAHEAAFNSMIESVKESGDKQTMLRLYQNRLPIISDQEERLPMLLSLSDLFVELDAAEAAFPYLEEAQNLSPDNIEIKRKLGDIYFASGNSEKAMEIYTALSELLSSDKSAKKDLAIIYHKIAGIKENNGNIEEAIDYCSKAQRLNPTYIPNIISLAQLTLKSGDLPKAQKLYRGLLFQKLGNEITKADIFCEVAKIDIQLGQNPKALASVKRGLSENPSHEELKAMLNDLQ